MTTQDEHKKRWKEESEQLKKDLNNRPKVIQKREVPIRVANPNKKQTTKTKTTTQNSKASDDFLRKKLGL